MRWLHGFSLCSQVSHHKPNIILHSYLFIVVVNMILINMMMAIINMAFEDIKSQSEAYKNKFEIIQYIKRSIRELTGVQ